MNIVYHGYQTQILRIMNDTKHKYLAITMNCRWLNTPQKTPGTNAARFIYIYIYIFELNSALYESFLISLTL